MLEKLDWDAKVDILDTEKIILSNNPNQICEYLGLEHSRWRFFNGYFSSLFSLNIEYILNTYYR